MKEKHRWLQISTGLVFFVTILVMTGAQKVEASHPCQVIVTTHHCHKIGHCVCPAGYTVHVH